MIGHRTYLDAKQSAFTRSVKQPTPRGHRAWLTPAIVDTRRMAKTENTGLGRSPSGDGAGTAIARKEVS